MYLCTLSPKQASVLLPFLLCLSIQVLASELERRVIGSCPDDENGDEASTLDGLTSDKSAGIGIEFETGQILFGADDCDKSATQKSKAKLINNRQEANWKLTGDSLTGSPGILDAEYILDGTQIKIGSGDAVKAASEVVDDITLWNPSADQQNNVYNIDGSTCNPWKITAPATGGGFAGFKWAPQITAPLPLEAISDLFSKAIANDQDSALLPSIRPVKNMVYVTKDFFQSKPNDISSDSVKADVLGFFSLILTYAKGATDLDGEQSPKHIGSIMPRTDYTTIFAQVKSAVPGTLYDIVKVLACYKNNGNGVEIDSDFCTGTVATPQPNGQMDKQAFNYEPENGDPVTCTVQDWILSIQNGNSPDKLTQFDQNFNSQVGGLGEALENILDTDRAVPLFEFRRLPGVKQPEMKDFVDKVEQALIAYHRANAAPLRLIRRRADGRYSHVKREGASEAPFPGPRGAKYMYKRDQPTACPASGLDNSAPAVTTPPTAKPSCDHQDSTPEVQSEYCVCQGSVTLPVLSASSGALNDPTKSCDYASLPDAKAHVTPTAPPEPLTTNSARCEVCSVVGENNQACSTLPNCIPQTPKAWVEVGKSAVHDGTLTSQALSSSISSALESICPEVTQTASMTNCSDETVNIQGIWYKDLADDMLNKAGQLEVKVTAGQYNATSLRNAMIDSVALTAMQSATGRNCYTEHYESGGITGKRSYVDQARVWFGLQERESPGANRYPESMTMCQATRFVGVQYLPPYWKECDDPCKPEDNFMWLDTEWDFKVAPGADFACDFINGLIDALVVVAPEFAIEDVELGEAIGATCKDAINNAKGG